VTYTYTDGKVNIAAGASSDGFAAVAVNGALIRVPVDHAQRIAEALTGRKIAAIVYEDELPEVGAGRTALDVTVDHAPMALFSVEEHWGKIHSHVARIRHIEARDAAAKEFEREREERVAKLAEELHVEYRTTTGQYQWHQLPEDVKDGWRAVARHVLADEEATS
jgi:hypothetical protein